MAFGYTKTASVLAQVASEAGYHKSLKLHVAGFPDFEPTGDLVLIGSDRGHDLVFDYLQLLRETYPSAHVHINDDCDTNNYILLNGVTHKYNWKVHAGTAPPPYDLALIVLWRNPYVSNHRKRRSMLCAGFTSYGTLAATKFVIGPGLQEVWRVHRRTLRDVFLRRHATRLPFRYSPKWPHLAMVVRFSMDSEAYEVLGGPVVLPDVPVTPQSAHLTIEIRDEAAMSAAELRDVGTLLKAGFPDISDEQRERAWIQLRPEWRILAMISGTIVGQIAVVDLQPPGGEFSCLGLSDLTVADSRRRRGIARFLIEAAVASCRRADASILMVASGPEVGLQGVFELQGFRPAGDRFFVQSAECGLYRNPHWLVRLNKATEDRVQNVKITSDF